MPPGSPMVCFRTSSELLVLRRVDSCPASLFPNVTDLQQQKDRGGPEDKRVLKGRKLEAPSTSSRGLSSFEL